MPTVVVFTFVFSCNLITRLERFISFDLCSLQIGGHIGVFAWEMCSINNCYCCKVEESFRYNARTLRQTGFTTPALLLNKFWFGTYIFICVMFITQPYNTYEPTPGEVRLVEFYYKCYKYACSWRRNCNGHLMYFNVNKNDILVHFLLIYSLRYRIPRSFCLLLS